MTPSPPGSALTFNIIYVRDTVKTLLPFAPTLLRHAPGTRFRLVSNGCTRAEEQEILALCETHPAFSFHSLGSESVLKHGEALNALVAQDESPWFAFMDSDIYAVGPFVPQLEAALRGHAAVFSCLPVWHQPEEYRMPVGFSTAGGRFVTTASGAMLGVSFLAVYRADALRACMQRTGADFMRRSLSEVSPALQSTLRAFASEARVFDTGKILNVALQQDEPATYVPLEGLVHIGAVSGLTRRRRSRWSRVRDRIIPLLPVAVERVLRSVVPAATKLSRQETESSRWLTERRRAVQSYMTALIQEGEPAASAHLQSINPELAGVIRRVGADVMRIHSDYDRWRVRTAERLAR
jgi:hypothetical protein